MSEAGRGVGEGLASLTQPTAETWSAANMTTKSMLANPDAPAVPCEGHSGGGSGIPQDGRQKWRQEMTQEPTTEKRAHHVVSVRLTDEDRELVAQVAESLGVSASKAVRLMLRRADGGEAVAQSAPIIHELREDLDDAVLAFGLLSRSLDRQGVLLNQIAAKINSGNPMDAHALSVIRECQQALDQTRCKLDAKPGELLAGFQMNQLLEEGDLWR